MFHNFVKPGVKILGEDPVMEDPSCSNSSDSILRCLEDGQTGWASYPDALQLRYPAQRWGEARDYEYCGNTAGAVRQLVPSESEVAQLCLYSSLRSARGLLSPLAPVCGLQAE